MKACCIAAGVFRFQNPDHVAASDPGTRGRRRTHRLVRGPQATRVIERHHGLARDGSGEDDDSFACSQNVLSVHAREIDTPVTG